MPGLAELKNPVTCVDSDEKKIDLLKNGVIPIYEPDLKELVETNNTQKRLSFTTDINKAIQEASVIFIAVGTPMAADGAADLTAVKKVAETIKDNLNDYKVIVIKSTVPIGTGSLVRSIIEDNVANKDKFDMVSNPEFLREGSAIGDFLKPDRIIVGAESPKALEVMRDVYKELIAKGVDFLETNILSAETIKYASNAFLAIKLSFINEMAQLADETGADVHMVARGMGLDDRIGRKFLQPGPGFGGSCFPKDCNALMHIAKKHNLDLKTVQAAIDVNDIQRKNVIKKLTKLMGESLEGKTIAVLGLAFKANTDDIRESPALDVITMLLEKGALINAYDPIAIHNTSLVFPHINYFESPYEAVNNADAVIVMTEWDELKKLDLMRVHQLLKQKNLVDARNLYKPSELKALGFAFKNMGRPHA